jgi:hypothetical protein
MNKNFCYLYGKVGLRLIGVAAAMDDIVAVAAAGTKLGPKTGRDARPKREAR